MACPLPIPLLPTTSSSWEKPEWLSTPSYTRLRTHHPSLLPLLLSCRHPRHLPQLHAHLVATGLARRSAPLSALLELSALSPSAADLPFALALFRHSFDHSLFAYNTLLRALSASPTPHLCLDLFLEMLDRGFVPNKFTFPFVIKSIFSIKIESFSGQCLHGQTVKLGLSPDPYVDSSLIRLYANYGDVNAARKLFDRLPYGNVVCWSAMLSGCVQWGRFREAVEMFHEFQHEGLEPNESMLVSVLCAVAHLGALEQGRWIHAYIKRKNFDVSVKVGTALINMYCKCGVVEEALDVFNRMKTRNLLSWTALISGMAMNGMNRSALDVFDQMLETGMRPDSVAFVGVLAACSHARLIEEGQRYFDEMSKIYKLMPKLEHYGCMVDLFGRAGLLDKALELLHKMPFEPDIAAWASLLNACKIHKDIEIGESIGKLLIEIDPLNDANYVLLSNVYCQGKRWANAIEIRQLMQERGVKKCPGCSVIEVDGVVQEFFVGDASDPRFESLRPTLDEMCKRLEAMGYVPDTSSVLLDIEEEEKTRVLCYHSEKLAIAYGLTNLSPRVPIRIVKNLRACVDCHSATKLISKAFSREIVIRDRQRFHHFKDGVCSCGDYW